MKALKIVGVLTLLSPFFANASVENKETEGIVAYINSTTLPENMKVKAEYLTRSLGRIFSENWKIDPKAFQSISSDINVSLSCYIHESKKTGSDLELSAVDEIQTLFTSNSQNSQNYEAFMKLDLQKQHEIEDPSICNALR